MYIATSDRPLMNEDDMPISTEVMFVDMCSVQQWRKFASGNLSGTDIRLQFDTTVSHITAITRESWESRFVSRCLLAG